jgi:hypothetical protein
MPAEANDKFSLSAPKSIMGMLALAVVGGGAMGMATGARQADAVTVATTGLTRPEVVQVATDAEARAKAHADAVGTAARDDCRRELATAQQGIASTLIRLENKTDANAVLAGNKMDAIAGSVENVKLDVATLKARRR